MGTNRSRRFTSSAANVRLFSPGPGANQLHTFSQIYVRSMTATGNLSQTTLCQSTIDRCNLGSPDAHDISQACSKFRGRHKISISFMVNGAW